MCQRAMSNGCCPTTADRPSRHARTCPQDWVGSLSTQAATAMHDLHAVAAAAGAPALHPRTRWMRTNGWPTRVQNLTPRVRSHAGSSSCSTTTRVRETSTSPSQRREGVALRRRERAGRMVDRREARRQGQADQRGLVPETFVSFDVEEEERAIARELKSAATPVKRTTRSG